MKKLFILPIALTILLSGCVVTPYDNGITYYNGGIPVNTSVTIVSQPYYGGYHSYPRYTYPRGYYFPYRPLRLGDHPPCRYENCRH